MERLPYCSGLRPVPPIRVARGYPPDADITGARANTHTNTHTHTHHTPHAHTILSLPLASPWPRHSALARARHHDHFPQHYHYRFLLTPRLFICLSREHAAPGTHAQAPCTRAHTRTHAHINTNTRHTHGHTTTSPQFYRVSLCKSSTSVTFLSASTDGPSVKARIPPSLQRIYRDLSCKRKTFAIPWAHLHRVFL